MSVYDRWQQQQQQQRYTASLEVVKNKDCKCWDNSEPINLDIYITHFTAET